MGSQDPETGEAGANPPASNPTVSCSRRDRCHLPAWATVTVAASPSGLTTSLSNSAPPPEFPYLVAPALYPAPANVSPGGAPMLVHLVATPTGTDFLLFVNHSAQQLWLAPGAYDPSDARALFSHQDCLSVRGPTCVPSRPVYLTWGQAVRVFSTSGTIQADALAAV